MPPEWTRDFGDGGDLQGPEGDNYQLFVIPETFDELEFWESDHVGTTVIEALVAKKGGKPTHQVGVRPYRGTPRSYFLTGDTLSRLQVRCGKHVNSVGWASKDGEVDFFVGGDLGYYHEIQGSFLFKSVGGVLDEKHGVVVMINFRIQRQ